MYLNKNQTWNRREIARAVAISEAARENCRCGDAALAQAAADNESDGGEFGSNRASLHKHEASGLP